MVIASGTLGQGVLWRPRTAPSVLDEIGEGRLGFVEVIAESVHRLFPRDLAAGLAAGARIVPHGVGLGLGGAEQPDRKRLAALARAAEVCEAPLVSEHIAFVRSGGLEAGHLLPVPRTREMLDVVVANVREATAALPVPLALEPIATLVEWPGAEMTEAQFLTELLERTEAGLVLDLANLHVNAANRRRALQARRAHIAGPPADSDVDPVALLDDLPLERIAYVHVAGGQVREGRWHDTHTDPLWPEAVDLVTELWSRVEPPGLLLERDDGHAGGEELRAELDVLARAMDVGRARRGPLRCDVPGPKAGDSGGPDRPDGPGVGSGPVRARLATEQEAFLKAALGVGPEPPGFDPDDIDAVGAVLGRKRARAVAHLVPDLAVLPDYLDRFVAWAGGRPTSGEAVDDAIGFFRSLPVEDRSPYAAAAVVRVQLRRRLRPIRVCRARRSLVAGVGVGARQRVVHWRRVR